MLQIRHTKLTRLREGLGLSMADLAAMAHVSESTISRLEAQPGKRARPRTVKKIADALRVAVEDLRLVASEDDTEDVA